MAITVSQIGTEQTGNSLSYTTVSGDTAVLIAVLDTSGDNNTLSCTWDTAVPDGAHQAMTRLGSVLSGDGNKLTLFGLANPSIGAVPSSITGWSGVGQLVSNQISFQGTNTVSTAACFTNTTTNTGTGTSLSVTVSSATGNLVVAAFEAVGGVATTSGTGWFLAFNGYAGSYSNGSSSVVSTAVVGGTPPWAAIGVNVVAGPVGSFQIRQLDWPLPQRHRPRSVSLLTHINQHDMGWVDRVPNSFRTWRPSFHAAINAWYANWITLQPILEQNPFSNYDWPNPRGRPRALQDWQDSFNLGLQSILPPRQLDWPLPMRARGSVPRDWMQPPSLALSTFVIVFPFGQTDWPNPYPPLAASSLRTWTDSFKLPLQTILPFSQADWPNPRAPATVITQGTWTDSFKLGLQTVLPFNQSEWPLPPSQARRNPEDWQDYILPGAPETMPPVPPILMAQQWM